MFSLGGCFPPSSLATAKARYSSRQHNTPFPKLTGISPSTLGCSKPLQHKEQRAANAADIPHISHKSPCGIQFRLSPFGSPLLGGSQLISFPPPTQMLHSGGFTFLTEHQDTLRYLDRKSYSGIFGSKAACAYPKLIAACHALHRLSSLAIHQTASARQRIFYGCLRDYAWQSPWKSRSSGSTPPFTRQVYLSGCI